MKKFSTLSLCLLMIFFTACQEDESPLIPTQLLGSWEMKGYSEYTDLDYVATWTFRADGTYENSSAMREPGGSVNLGFDFIDSGTFRGEDNNSVFINRTEFLHKPNFGSKIFYPKDELEEGSLVDNREYMLTFEIRDNGQTLFFPSSRVGDDGIMPAMEFTKVN